MTPYLSFNELGEFKAAATSSGLLLQPRVMLFREIRESFVGTLRLDPAPATQFTLDVNRLNTVERLEDGSVPFALYLRNAADMTRDLPEGRIFQKYMSKVMNAAGGLTLLAPLATLPASVLTKEAIIHQDDTVDVAFIQGCLTCSRSVAKLVVPRFDNGVQKMLGSGAPWLFNGTGWLLAPDVLITNHHVINARTDGESTASDSDFARQARETLVMFDFDTDRATTVTTTVKAMEAADVVLDFCVLRLRASTERPGLTLLNQPVSITAATYLPLNVIQHPHGKAKRVAIRNNLAVDADDDVIRYYTDTDAGSSGSPVFDDLWQVVALHRGAMLRQAKFQGKDTAFVNVGSQITRILQTLRNMAPALCAELRI